MASTRKTFVTGQTLPASDLNTYLMEQVVVKVDTTTDLNATLASQGVRVAYCIGDNRLYYYNGSSWSSNQTTNAGFGANSGAYRWSEHYGGGNTTITLGNYYIPIQLEASTQLSYVYMQAATFSTNTSISATLYTSLNGKPNTKIGLNAAGSITSTSPVALLAANYLTVRPGLYYWAIGISATNGNTYATVTQSATQGGPVFMSQYATNTDWTLMPAGGFKGSAGTYSATFAGSAEAVVPTSVAPIVRYLMNSTNTPTTPESGV